MTRNRRRISGRAGLLAAFVFLGAGEARGDVLPPGHTVFPFTKVETDARPVGMGGAFTAVADDASAVLWNPAGLAGLPAADVTLSEASWIQQISESSAQVGFPGFGGSYRLFSSPRQPGRDAAGAMGPGWIWGGWTATVAAAHRFGNFAVGAAAEADDDPLGTRSTLSFLPSAGLLWDLGSFSLGAAGLHIGQKALGGNAPTEVRAGASWRPSEKFVADLEVDKPADDVARAVVGAEWAIVPSFTLRAGYRYRQDGWPQGSLAGVSGGAGLSWRAGKYWQATLDYGYWPAGDLGQTHRVTFHLAHLYTAPAQPKPPLTASVPRPAPTARAPVRAPTPAPLAVAPPLPRLPMPKVTLAADGRYQFAWQPARVPGVTVAGYNFYAVVGAGALRKLNPAPLHQFFVALKKPNVPGGTTIRVQVRAVDAQGREVAETGVGSLPIH